MFELEEKLTFFSLLLRVCERFYDIFYFKFNFQNKILIIIIIIQIILFNLFFFSFLI